jgi:hypothetical protein
MTAKFKLTHVQIKGTELCRGSFWNDSNAGAFQFQANTAAPRGLFAIVEERTAIQKISG